MAGRDEILMNAVLIRSNKISTQQQNQHARKKPMSEEQEILWTLAEENILALVREMEWAEAYAEDHPGCSMGALYLNFLRWELVTAQADL